MLFLVIFALLIAVFVLSINIGQLSLTQLDFVILKTPKLEKSSL